MVRITIQHINKVGAPEFPARERRVYVDGDCTVGEAEKIVERFRDRFKSRSVVRYFRDQICRQDVEPDAVFVEKVK